MNHPPDDPPELFASLPAEPPARRLRQYAFMVCCAVLVVVFGVWLMWSYSSARTQAESNAAAAKKLCKQLVGLGQNCVEQPRSGPKDEVANGQAQVPAPTGSLSASALPPVRSPGQPAPTDENGVALAYQPGEGALVVAVGVEGGRLILSFDDGARLDAGAVDEQLLSIVLKQIPSASPSPVASPSPSPSPVYPYGADGPDPTPTGAHVAPPASETP